MGLVSFDFLVLLALAAGVYKFIPGRARPAFLACASYAFYATWNVRMGLVLFGLSVFVFAVGRQLKRLRDRPGAGWLTAVTVTGLVGYIGIFKAAEALHRGGDLLLPVGLSYYTFKLISYVIDVYWGTADPELNLIHFLAYIAFFPQIVAGPIQRGSEFLPQIRQVRTPDRTMLLSGVGRILLGCFKKLAVADPLAQLVSYGFGHATAPPGLPRLMAFYIFPIQLFADFSALTDIAIGAARLFGIESPENFDAPYFAVSISTFWRRWHMTLTNWLRDYVFTPLRMQWRNWGNWGLVASITVNMVLIGLWHGFSLPFLAFGFIHAGYLSVDALTLQLRKKWYRSHPLWDKVTNCVGPILVFQLVSVADLFFRAPSFADGWMILTRLYSGVTVGAAAAVASVSPAAWSGLAAYVMAELIEFIRRHNPESYLYAAPRRMRWAAVSCAAVVSLFFLAILLARQTAVNPFVYAIF